MQNEKDRIKTDKGFECRVYYFGYLVVIYLKFSCKLESKKENNSFKVVKIVVIKFNVYIFLLILKLMISFQKYYIIRFLDNRI